MRLRALFLPNGMVVLAVDGNHNFRGLNNDGGGGGGEDEGGGRRPRPQPNEEVPNLPSSNFIFGASSSTHHPPIHDEHHDMPLDGLVINWKLNGERLIDFLSLNMEMAPNGSLLLHNFSILQSGFYACEAANFVAKTLALFVGPPITRSSDSQIANNFVNCFTISVYVLWFLVGCLATSCMVLAYILGALFLFF